MTHSLFAYCGAEMVTDASATPDTGQYKRTYITVPVIRFARSTRDLPERIEKLTATGVKFVSKKAIDTTVPTGKFMLTVCRAAAELERNISCSAKGKTLPSPRSRKVQGAQAHRSDGA